MPRHVLAVLIAFGLTATPALAQTKKPPESADAQAAARDFKQAQERFEAKDFSAALELARKALGSSGSPNARLYVARSLRELGRLDEAYEELELTLHEARSRAEKDPKYAATRDTAAAELALLDQRVAKIIVAVVDAPPGARIELNGKRVDPSRLGQPIVIVPGDVVLKGTAEGAGGVEKQSSIKAAQTETLTLVFRKANQRSPTRSRSVPERKSPEPGGGGGLRTAGYVTVGVGVIGMGVFAVAGSMASSKFSELEDECGSERCTDPKYADTVDSGKRLDTIANIGLVTGTVALLAGSAMILFGGPGPESGSAALAASPQGATLRYFKRF